MNVTNRTTLLITYLEGLPLVVIMTLVVEYVLHLEIDTMRDIIGPFLIPPLFALGMNLLLGQVVKWRISISFTVGLMGALVLPPSVDIFRCWILSILFWLFFFVLNEKVLRLQDRIPAR